MIGMKATTVDETAQVEKAVDKASYRNLGHAAASVRKRAKESIKISDEPSRPGRPPHSRRGQLRAALWFAVTREESATTAVAGPRFSVVGESASPHEHGGRHQGAQYRRRPFMGPALRASIGRFRETWAGSVRR